MAHVHHTLVTITGKTEAIGHNTRRNSTPSARDTERGRRGRSRSRSWSSSQSSSSSSSSPCPSPDKKKKSKAKKHHRQKKSKREEQRMKAEKTLHKLFSLITESGEKRKASGEEAQRLREQAEAPATVLTGQFRQALSSSSNSANETGMVNTSPSSAFAFPPRPPGPPVPPQAKPTWFHLITHPIELPVVQPVVPLEVQPMVQPIVPNPAPRVCTLSHHQMRWLEAELNHKIKVTGGSKAEATGRHCDCDATRQAGCQGCERLHSQARVPRSCTAWQNRTRRIDVPVGNGAMILRSHNGSKVGTAPVFAGGFNVGSDDCAHCVGLSEMIQSG